MNNPYKIIGRQELEKLTSLYGYVCASPDGLDEGYGSSTWLAMKDCFGSQKAGAYADLLNEPCGAKLSGWLTLDIACLDQQMRMVETQWLEDEDGEILCYLYR